MTSLDISPPNANASARDIPTLRKYLDGRYGSLRTERQTWDRINMDIAAYLFPGGGRFFTYQRNRGDANDEHLILNCMASQALDILAAGLMSGATSPARPWFKIGMEDPDLDEDQDVRLWCNIADERVRAMLARCGTYRAFASLYQELPAFGTGVNIILPHPRDPSRVIHHYPVTAGEYCLAANFEGEIDTLYREFEMSVSAVVRRFGLKNVSEQVRQSYNRGAYEAGVVIRHAIEPRPDRDENQPNARNLRDPSKQDGQNMPWRSVFWEAAARNDLILADEGFRRFPVLAPRWSVLGNDCYGRGPGRQCLPDVITLQQKELRVAQVHDYQTQGPLGAPSVLQGREVNMLPGGVTFYDAVGQNNMIRPIYEAQYAKLDDFLKSVDKTESLISRSFFVDVFRMITDQTKEMTVPEILARQEEKLQQLGPMLEHLHSELLQPVVETTFERMLEAGMLPPPPQAIRRGVDEYRVEFVSLLAQAQRAIATNTTARFLGTITSVAELVPEIMDNLDTDALFESTMVDLGADPKLQRRKQDRDAIRAQRAKAQAAQQQTEMMATQAKAARDLASAPTAGPANALTDANQVMGQLTGYGSPLPA